MFGKHWSRSLEGEYHRASVESLNNPECLSSLHWQYTDIPPRSESHPDEQCPPKTFIRSSVPWERREILHSEAARWNVESCSGGTRLPCSMPFVYVDRWTRAEDNTTCISMKSAMSTRCERWGRWEANRFSYLARCFEKSLHIKWHTSD